MAFIVGITTTKRATTVARDIPVDPSTWTISNVNDALNSVFPQIVGGREGYLSNRAYLDGDHFQDAVPWKGPGRNTAGTISEADKAAIEQTLTPVPEMEDCTGYRTDGVCGTEAEPTAAPKQPSGPEDDEGKPTLSQAEEAERELWKSDIGVWWRRVEYWKHVRNAFKEASAAQHACIRLVINSGRTETAEDGRRLLPAQPDRATALLNVECTSPTTDACAIYTDPDTFQKVGIWRGKTRDGQRDLAEIWYADGEETVWRKIEGETVTERRFPWGGLLPVIALEVEPILTTPVREMQAALDTESTGLLRNGMLHSYTQRNEYNTLPPGEWLTTPPSGQSLFKTEVRDGVTYYYHETGTRELGSSVTVNMYGIETLKSGSAELGTAEYEYHSPQVDYHEPSSPENIITGADWFITRIREACRQGHRTSGSGSTAEASGDAYEQKRARFEADLLNCGSSVAGFVERGLMTLTVIGDWLAGADEPTFLSDWEVGATVHTDAGPVSSAKMQQLGEWMDKGRLSRATVLGRVGIRDVRDEEERIAAQNTLSTIKERAEAAKSLIDAGADRRAAWEKVGFTSEEAEALARADGNFVTEQ